MDNLRCPQCESPNVVQVDTDRYECPYCGKTFNRQEAIVAQHSKRQKIVTQQKKYERTGKGITFLTILFFLLVVIGVIGYAVYEVKNTPTHSKPEKKTETAQNNAVEVAKKVEEENKVEDKVREIYAQVIRRKLTEDYSINLEKKYCTQEWNQLEEGLVTYYDKTGNIIIDSDLWINAQDFSEDLSLVDVIKYKEYDEHKVWVLVKISNFGGITPIMLEMSKEKGDWKVADFLYEKESGGYGSWKDYIIKEITSDSNSEIEAE